MILERQHVVLGSSLSALLFAYINDYAVVFTKPRTPFKFDYLSTKLDLSSLKIPFNNLTLKSFDSKMQVGIQKVLLWERILFLQSLRGNIISTKDAHSLRLAGNTITISNEYSKILDLVFEKCYYYGDDGAAGFTEKTDLDEATYICYDYIAFNSGGKHEIDYIRTGDDFVSEIWFYSSDRIDGNTPVRDACAVSTLTEQQLLDFDHSETMARFKTIHEMESRGMKGQFAGGYTTAGNPKHYKFRTTSLYRDTTKPSYELTPQASNIYIPSVKEEDLLQSLSPACLAYDRLLRYW